LLTLHPTERLDIAMEDDPSSRWGVWISAAVARPGWRGAPCSTGDGRGEPVLGEMVQRVTAACLLSQNCFCCVVVAEVPKLAVLLGGTDSLVAFS